MFNFHLGDDEKQALLKLVGYLAASDDHISPVEQEFVRDLARDLNTSADGVFDELDTQNLEELCAPFTRKSARRIVLVELINLALSDNIYFTEEAATIQSIAQIMGVSAAQLDAIDDWVRRGNEWHAEGHLLLGLHDDEQEMDT